MKWRKRNGERNRMASETTTRWRSCAKWPDGLLSFCYPDHDNTTRDIHDTKEQAEAVCAMLEREGLGGERIHFPARTWIEPEFEARRSE